MGQPTFQQFNANQGYTVGNPWQKENPNNSDYFQMITEQNLRDGMPPKEAEFSAVRDMQHFMKSGESPMSYINGREAGYNESQGKQLERDGEIWQQQQDAVSNNLFGKQVGQAITHKGPTPEELAAAEAAKIHKQNVLMDSFDKWRMQRGEAPMGIPNSNVNRGWGNASESLENLRNLEIPKFKQ